VYVPFDYDPTEEWPLILFLHGAGERGDDGLIQSEVGIGRAVRRWSERFPCIVVMPQCPTGVWWDKVLRHVELAMEQTLAEYRIDTDRLYLTGLSMGGYGTWLIGAREPDQYAALMPICGGGEPRDAAVLAKTPIWAFHGGQDGTVKPEKSREMVEAVKRAGGDVQYTEYPDLSHNSWDAAYSEKDAIAWLLKQRR
jgi:predicted peptidase